MVNVLSLFIVRLNAVDEVEGSEWVRDILVGAVLDLVVDTFAIAVLAGESPGVTGSVLMSVAVRNQEDLCHVEEARGCECFGKTSSNVILAVRAERLEVKLNLDFLSSCEGC